MIIFMGVAGSGKSLQGKMLADQLALPWLSTGEFLRMLVAGERRRDMLAGKLLDDEDIIGLVQKIFTVVDTDEDFVLDGFPRTSAQTDWLPNQAKHGQLDITCVVHLVADEEVVLNRLLGRGRQDDTEESIRARFDEYEAAIKPVLQQFRDGGVTIHEIDAEGDPSEIHRQLVEKVRG